MYVGTILQCFKCYEIDRRVGHFNSSFLGKFCEFWMRKYSTQKDFKHEKCRKLTNFLFSISPPFSISLYLFFTCLFWSVIFWGWGEDTTLIKGVTIDVVNIEILLTLLPVYTGEYRGFISISVLYWRLWALAKWDYKNKTL